MLQTGLVPIGMEQAEPPEAKLEGKTVSGTAGACATVVTLSVTDTLDEEMDPLREVVDAQALTSLFHRRRRG